MGMGNILRSNVSENHHGPEQSREIEVRASNITNLLIDFLSEVLSYIYIDKILYYKIEIFNVSKTVISARITGHPLDYLDEEIKAVTYHEAEVINDDKNNWQVTIIFDI